MKIGNILLVLIGFSLNERVNLFGLIGLGELALIILGVISFVTKNLLIRRGAVVFVMLVLWMLSVLISDAVNGIPLGYLVKGMARPLLLMFLIEGLLWIFRKNNFSVVKYVFFGLLLWSVKNTLFPGDFRLSEEAIELASQGNFVYAYFAFIFTPLLYSIMALLVYISRKGTAARLFSIIVLSTLILLVSNSVSRTTASVMLLTLSFIFYNNILKRIFRYFLNTYGQFNLRSFVRILFSGLLISSLLLIGYAEVGKSGNLPENQQEKFDLQTQGTLGKSALGLLLNGRGFSLGAMVRVCQRPVFGFGSWGEQGDSMLIVEDLLGISLKSEFLDPKRREIGHSVLFGIWAQNGILVVPMLVYAFYSVVHLIILAVSNENYSILSLLLPYLLLFLFSFFFNNFSVMLRFVLALAVSINIIQARVGNIYFKFK